MTGSPRPWWSTKLEELVLVESEGEDVGFGEKKGSEWSRRGWWDNVKCHFVKRECGRGGGYRKMDGGTGDATRRTGTTGSGVVVIEQVGRRGIGVCLNATGTGGRRRRRAGRGV